MKKLLLFLVAFLAAYTPLHAADYYLIGGFNDWALKQDNCKFTDQGDGSYVLDYEGTLPSGFKINDGTWSNDNANFGGNGNLVLGEVYALVVGGSSGNITLEENIENPHLVFNPEAKTLLITGQGVEATYIYGIHGQIFEGGSDWTSMNMAEEDGKWTYTGDMVSGDFGIYQKDADSDAQTKWFNVANENDKIVALGAAIQLSDDGASNLILSTPGNYTFTFDPEALTLTVTGQPILPDLYLVGEFNGWKLQDETHKMNENDGIYTFTCTRDLIKGEGFKVVGPGESWDGLINYGTGGIVYANRETPIYSGGDNVIVGQNISDAVIVFDLNKCTITIEGTPDVDLETMPVVYLATDHGTPHAYIYADGLGDEAGWGTDKELMEKTDMTFEGMPVYKHVFDEKFMNGRVIFHCESGHQFPGNGEPGLEIDGFTHILLHTDDASSWVPFNTPVVNFESVYEAESSAPETDVVVATVKGGEALFTVDGKTATEVAATALYDTKGQNELVEVSYTGLTNLAGVVFPGASAQVIVSHKPVTIYLALHRELATAGSVPTITIGEKTYTPEATDKYHVYEVGKVTEDGEMFYDYASVYTVTVAPEHIFGAPVLNVPAQPASVRAAAPAEGEAQHTLNGSDALVKYIDGTPVWSNDFDAADLKDETGVSGIEAIIAAGNDSEVVFYNLQGIRVEGELAPGMYIRRQGNTAVKVCVK